MRTIPYRPSNGTEGSMFASAFCHRSSKSIVQSGPCGSPRFGHSPRLFQGVWITPIK